MTYLSLLFILTDQIEVETSTTKEANESCRHVCISIVFIEYLLSIP